MSHNLIILRVAKGSIEVADTLEMTTGVVGTIRQSAADHIRDFYLYDSPEGEVYAALDTVSGTIIGRWKVQTAKELFDLEGR